MARTRHTGTFLVTGSDGRLYTISVHTEYRDAPTLGAREELVEGRQTLWTATGRAVQRRCRGEYQMLGTGVLLRSHDAQAP